MADDLLSKIRGEIDARLTEMRPYMDEYEQLLVAAEALVRERQTSAAPKASAKARAPKASRAAEAKPPRAARGAAREAILAALEHGSHTVAELVVVTAMSGPNVNGNLRRLHSDGAIAKTEREGKTAWTLPGAAA